MKNIYKTIEFTADYLRSILPQFSRVELNFHEKVEFNDEEVWFFVRVSETKYIIELSIVEIDTIIKYDCRILSEEEESFRIEHEFNHEDMTLKETLNHALNWIAKRSY